MGRVARLIAAAALATAAAAPPARAQAPAQLPHAWLFGTWTGGLFPVAAGISAQACLSQPVVIFTRDLVMRATLLDQTYVQRLISTVNETGAPRHNPNAPVTGLTINFVPAPRATDAGAGLLGLAAGPPAVGFGCDSPDVLHVLRRGENEISFPGCAEFPNPLVRCPSR